MEKTYIVNRLNYEQAVNANFNRLMTEITDFETGKREWNESEYGRVCDQFYGDASEMYSLFSDTDDDILAVTGRQYAYLNGLVNAQ